GRLKRAKCGVWPSSHVLSGPGKGGRGTARRAVEGAPAASLARTPHAPSTMLRMAPSPALRAGEDELFRAPYAAIVQANLRDSQAGLQRSRLRRHAAQPHNGAIMLLRNFLVDLHGRVQGRASGGFSTTGMRCSSAISRILRAIRSTPLATQTGAFMPRSYLRAIA